MIIIKRKRMHHIGIVLPDMEKAVDFMEKFGFEKDHMEYVEKYHAYCLFTKHNENETPLEFIIPTEGVLKEFRDGKGGIHHIAIEVEDIGEAEKECRAKGMELLEKSAVRSSEHIMCNFVRPKSGNGILVEFIQEV